MEVETCTCVAEVGYGAITIPHPAANPGWVGVVFTVACISRRNPGKAPGTSRAYTGTNHAAATGHNPFEFRAATQIRKKFRVSVNLDEVVYRAPPMKNCEEIDCGY